MTREEPVRALYVRFYQPHAHYRMPFSYQRRLTYPLPPYSTLIGLLCNVLGIENLSGEGEPCNQGSGGGCRCDFCMLKKLGISIAGEFESVTTEYTWIRTISAANHYVSFGSVRTREADLDVKHFGGQVPVVIDVLNDVNLFVFLWHEDAAFLEKLKRNIVTPSKRLRPLCLGRGEDLIVLMEEPRIVNLRPKNLGKKRLRNRRNGKSMRLWIPMECTSGETPAGICYKIPTFYSLVKKESTEEKKKNKNKENEKKDGGCKYARNFEYADVFLNFGNVSWLKCHVFYQDKREIPVFFYFNSHAESQVER